MNFKVSPPQETIKFIVFGQFFDLEEGLKNITRATRQILRIKINDEKNRVYSNITIYIIVRTCRYPWKGTHYTKELKHLSNTSNSAAFAVLKRLKTFVENKESKSLMLPVKLS